SGARPMVWAGGPGGLGVVFYRGQSRRFLARRKTLQRVWRVREGIDMNWSFTRHPRVIALLLLMFSALLCLEAYSDPNEKNPPGRRHGSGAGGDDRTAKLMKLNSAGDFLALDDLDKFRPGRRKNEILKDLRWRAGYTVAAKCDGKSITAIAYTIYAEPERVY